MNIKRISDLNDSHTINNSNKESRDSHKNPLHIAYVFKSLHLVFMAFGLQKISFVGNNIIPMTNRAKMYPFILLGFLIWLYCYSIFHKFQTFKKTEKSISGSSHIITVNILLITAASIYSSAIKNSCIYFKLTQNIQYLDEKLQIPSAWYVKIRHKVKIIFFFYMLYFAYISLWDEAVWKFKKNLHFHTTLILMFCKDLIMFQYLFDVWIVVDRLNVLTYQLIDLVQPILQQEDVALEIDVYFSKKYRYKSDEISENKFAEERFEDGIKRLMSVYDKLADNIGVINSFYGVQVRKNEMDTFYLV